MKEKGREDNKMHTLKLNVEDSVFDKVLYLLKSLPDGDVEILLDESTETKRGTAKSGIDFSKFQIKSFTKIEDSVEWQRLLRDDWDR